MNWVLKRLTEPSTYTGLLTFAVTALLSVHPEFTPIVLKILGGAYGVVKVVTPEKKPNV